MFTIIDYDKEREAKTLEHSSQIFHQALADGDSYYHVYHDSGPSYDILYKGNTEWLGDRVPAYAGNLLPEYREYDEYEEESIDIEFLQAYRRYVCYTLTEYSIAIARSVLSYTDGEVYFADPRILWFIEPDARLHILSEEIFYNSQIADDNQADRTIYLVGPLGKGFGKGETVDENYNKKSDLFVFHSAFYLQDMLRGRKRQDMKYIAYPMARSAMGIGGILINTSTYQEYARQLGLQIAHNGDHIAKFRVSDLERYFCLNFRREDSREDNTLIVDKVPYVYLTWRYYQIASGWNPDIIVERFRRELEEYAEAVIEEKRTLGLLIRGTDYKSTGMTGSRQQATVEDMIPLIDRWVEDYGYELLILATEDQDILDQMVARYGHRLRAIAQERHRASEFHQGQIINDLEKEIYTEEEYDSRVLDNNINYFYALYMLSRCDAFLSSGQNNGWDTVCAMNEGRFERKHRLTVEEV